MEIFGLHLSDYGPEALCALFIIMIFLQMWVPAKSVKKWQEVAERSQDQLDKLITSVEPMSTFITELKAQLLKQQNAQDNGGEPKQGGEPR